VSEVSTIGLDLAKHVFQAHGADASGKVVFRKRLRRERVLELPINRRGHEGQLRVDLTR
jgi:transposase